MTPARLEQLAREAMCPCPCCEGRGEHDSECTFPEDSPADWERWTAEWERMSALARRVAQEQREKDAQIAEARGIPGYAGSEAAARATAKAIREQS